MAHALILLMIQMNQNERNLLEHAMRIEKRNQEHRCFLVRNKAITFVSKALWYGTFNKLDCSLI